MCAKISYIPIALHYTVSGMQRVAQSAEFDGRQNSDGQQALLLHSLTAKHPIHLQELCMKLAKIIKPMVQSAMDTQGKKPLNSEAISAHSLVTISAATAKMISQKLSVRGLLASLVEKDMDNQVWNDATRSMLCSLQCLDPKFAVSLVSHRLQYTKMCICPA